MSAAVKRRPQFTVHEIDLALTTVILCGGNTVKAAGHLTDAAEPGQRVPARRTLDEWKKSYAERYAELQTELAPRIAERIAAQAEEIALKLASVEDTLIEQIVAKADELDADKASAALRNVTTSKALQYDKLSSPTRGRPSVITEHRTSHQLLAKLATTVGYDITSTAEELTELDPPAHQEPPAANARSLPPSAA